MGGLAEFAARLRDATRSVSEHNLRELDGDEARDVPELEVDEDIETGRPATRVPRKNLDAAAHDQPRERRNGKDAGGVGRVDAQALGGAVELDVAALESAGVVLPPRANPPADRDEGGARAAVAEATLAVAPVARPDKLLRFEAITAALWAAAIGLFVGVWPAHEAARRIDRERVGGLENELASSVERPLAVRAGRLRTPDAIAAALDDVYEDITSRFVSIWIGTGVLLAVGLFFAPRPRWLTTHANPTQSNKSTAIAP